VPTVAQPAANLGGKGTLQDQDGTGWNTLAAKGTWRQNDRACGAHIVDFGLGRDAYRLNISKYNVLGDWQSGPANEQSVVSQVGGRAETRYAWAQDSWQLARDWKAVLGLRWEDWTASQGHTATASSQLSYAQRSESHFSPKAALAYQLARNTTLKASLGRAVRFPTVGELYGATSGGALSFINDPNLKPEKSWTGELTAEQDLGNGLLRATWFHERTRDALYSQLIAGTTISAVQNVDQVRTSGLELAYSAQSVWIRGLDLGGSLTWANSRITANAANPASVGKWQPRVPRWRATAWATYKPDERWALTVAARYSGPVLESRQQRCACRHLYGCQPVFQRRSAGPLSDRQTAVGRLWHRQRQQCQVLELPPYPREALAPPCAGIFKRPASPPWVLRILKVPRQASSARARPSTQAPCQPLMRQARVPGPSPPPRP
jgi:iron complex outermembrane receptor protein